MGRSIASSAGLVSIGLVSAGLGALLIPGGLAARALFDSSPLQQDRFAVLAQPVGSSNWKLLVLEQIKASPRCWKPRADGLVEPSLNSFNFAGICSRYLDSNSYSLRSGGQDLGTRFRLRLKQTGRTLQLHAIDPREAAPIPIGQGSVSRRDRNGFVRLTLNDNWALERRVYKGRTLSHLYFAHPEPVNNLLAKADSGDVFSSLGGATRPSSLPPIGVSSRAPRRVSSTGPIRLQVIPFKQR